MVADLKNKSILVTGGAGFIGSNIVDYLVKLDGVKITVLDNLSTGNLKNIDEHIHSRKIDFIKGDITIYDDCLQATLKVDVVLHQAALGSVPRSIQDPLATHAANVTGFVNMLEAARQNKIKRFVYASSSSVYGDDATMPKQEHITGKSLSPYAVSKKANELYAAVFSQVYAMEIIGLRYFNVFGPKQNPKGPYAAVIPIFIDKLLNAQQATIYGDGTTTRDFTYVDNVVHANLLAASVQNKNSFNTVYNVAYGSTTSLNDLHAIIARKVKTEVKPRYEAARVGEIKDSHASIQKIKEALGYSPKVSLEDGLQYTIDWFKTGKF